MLSSEEPLNLAKAKVGIELYAKMLYYLLQKSVAFWYMEHDWIVQDLHGYWYFMFGANRTKILLVSYHVPCFYPLSFVEQLILCSFT